MKSYHGQRDPLRVKGDELYHLYSCSKPITCTAALQLWEKGLFSLEDRLSDYMPEFAEMYVKTEGGLKKAENPILIRHLFEMTAGFTDLSKPSTGLTVSLCLPSAIPSSFTEKVFLPDFTV